MTRKEKYNLRSMRKYGWGPEDIGLSPSASLSEVELQVRELQAAWELSVDGLVGPMTSRRLLLERERRQAYEYTDDKEGTVELNGRLVNVDFNAHPFGAPIPKTYTEVYDLTKYSKPRKNPPINVVWHWDVCTSAARCYRALKARKLSSHGCIDNDGTFYQFLDFGERYGWHAGSKANKPSIGIDISNAVYTKYNKLYEERGYGKRPEITAKVNGYRHKRFLGYYPAQIETAKKLAMFLHDYLGIELATPLDLRSETDNNVISSPHKFRGHIAHYHISKMKWDVAGFPFKYVIGDEADYEFNLAK